MPGAGLLWRHRLSLVTGFTCATLFLSFSAQADLGGAAPPFHPTRILVKPKAQNNLQQLHIRQGAHLVRQLPDQGIQVVELSAPGQVLQAVESYNRSGEVEFAEPDYILHTAIAPDDPSYVDGSLWALHNTGQTGGTAGADLGAELGWGLLNDASNVVVAIVDTGIRYTHEDLAANIWTNPNEIDANGQDDDQDGYVDDVHGINAIDKSGDPWDDVGHGTHVAGIIGAVGNNGKGVVGVAWKVQLMACKFMDSNGNGATSDAITCIDYARTHGAQIINASWGGPGNSKSLQSAIKRAQAAGIIFVVAAGNDSQDLERSPSYPASYKVDNMVVVAATTRNDLLANYSNFGAKSVTLAAPGSAILSTWNDSDDSYAVESGTSMATPYVTGVLALTKAHFPDKTYTELIARVTGGVDTLPNLAGKCSSGGRLNLRKALGVGAASNPVHLAVLSNGSSSDAQFSLSGDANAQYVIEASGDLNTWVPLLTKQASAAGSLTFGDPASATSAQRYYRARLVPLK